MGASATLTTISSLGGTVFSTCALTRRKTNGRISVSNEESNPGDPFSFPPSSSSSSSSSDDPFSWMAKPSGGASLAHSLYFSTNSSGSWPKFGEQNDKSAQSSVMLFWSGVPVSSTRNAAGNFASDPFRARYNRDCGFLRRCASSTTTTPHFERPSGAVSSNNNCSYVVMTTSTAMPFRSFRTWTSVRRAASRPRADPWYTITSRLVQCWNSRCQWAIVESGATISAGNLTP
mmetsp:Transcript_13605/g.42082  ORF Transcript_13605/g.42082 Transcript_13605/m.42082 type:complete len:232 (+) Transcript_13605:1144-1839(+)